MAAEWKTTRFETAPVTIIDGDRGKNYPKTADFYETEHCLFLNAGNVTATGFEFSDCQFITREKDYALRKGKLIREDVVLTTRGTVGNVAYYNGNVPHEHIRINSGMVIFRPDASVVVPRFLYLFLRSSAFKAQVAALRTGSAQPQLPIRDINRIVIPVPPLDEQKAIAHILGTLDDKIELNRRMNETLEGVARAIFKSWFVDFDPVRAKLDGQKPVGMDAATAVLFPDAFEDSELGPIPKGWGFGPLSSLADVIMGTSPPGTTYNDEGIGTPLVNGPVEFGDCFPIKRKWTTAPTRFSQSHDLIFCVRGSTTGRRVISDDVYCLGRGVCAIRAKKGQQLFVNRTIDSEIDRLLSRTTGSVFPNLSAPQIKGFDVLSPPAPIRQAFHRSTAPLQKRIECNMIESRCLASVRDTLLPRLLSGEIRVAEADKLVEVTL